MYLWVRIQTRTVEDLLLVTSVCSYVKYTLTFAIHWYHNHWSKKTHHNKVSFKNTCISYNLIPKEHHWLTTAKIQPVLHWAASRSEWDKHMIQLLPTQEACVLQDYNIEKTTSIIWMRQQDRNDNKHVLHCFRLWHQLSFYKSQSANKQLVKINRQLLFPYKPRAMLHSLLKQKVVLK